MKNNYSPKIIEPKWQKYWEKEKLFKADDKDKKRPKFYCLDMFPYPSGAGLHVGHVESYTATDIYSRFMRMNGYNVLHPQGWDAFGLPAENYAIKTKIHPKITTKKALANFKRQIKSMGFSYDWDREINTSDPEYYKWTQWIFLELYKNGLAYQKKAPVNWCESCQTVLAREQVVDGKCERCGNVVIQKNLTQWFFKITDYAEKLLDGLKNLNWPESIKLMQENWIGRSKGAEIQFSIYNSQFSINVFTTRPDTIFGATYLVLAPEHEFVASLLKFKNQNLKIKNIEEVKNYVKKTQSKTELERTSLEKIKTGVELKGIKAINPATKKEIPIYIADYVLTTYGTGAIMAVPAHDERDHEFAKKYDLPMIEVISLEDNNGKCYTGNGKMINSSKFDDMKSEEAKDEITEFVGGKKSVQYRLKDWLVSRQRYWGAPIPIIYCDNCAKNKEQVLILHGWEDNSQSVFIPELKKDLESKGYEVFVFDAPNTDEPVFEEWYTFIKKKIKDSKLKDFHIIGHSLGGHLAAKLAEEYKLKSLTLVCPVGFQASEKYFKQDSVKLDTQDSKIYEKFQDRKLDVNKVKNNSREINFIFGEKDPWITEEIRNYYIKNFDDVANINILKGIAHFASEEKIYKVSEIENLFSKVNSGIFPVPEKDLPVKLPDDVDFRPKGESPLARSKMFHDVKCPKCSSPARRESDTMDTFVCSSWYYLRYSDPKNDKQFASNKMLKKWLPVDLYIGGKEHATGHLIFSRFITKALKDLKYLNFNEPFTRLNNQGIIIASDGRKMSKSLGNVINPDDVVSEFGADSLRMYEMFMGPLEDQKPWDTKGIVGIKRFLDRVWNLTLKLKTQNEKIKTITKNSNLLNQTIQKVTSNIKDLKFNTAISAMMIFVNEISKNYEISMIDTEKFLITLSPFAPHIAEELWHIIGHDESIFSEKWPKAAEVKIDRIKVAIQINGKVRGIIETSPNSTEKEILELAQKEANIAKYLEDKIIKKSIYISGKILSLVI